MSEQNATIKAGLIGFGLSGATFHAPILCSIPDYEIAAVVSSHPEKVYKALPEAVVYSQVEQLLNDASIDIVIVTSPNATHYEYAKNAIEAGKHVVVEKPFTVTSEEAKALIALAKNRGVLLTVYQNRRWDNDFLTARNLLETGALGRLSLYYAQFNRYRPDIKNSWKEQDEPGTGLLYDLGSHLLDQALLLFGKPQSIWADLREERPGSAVTDYFHLVLAYENHRAILHAGSLVRQAGPRFELHGDKGSFLKYGLDPQEGQLKQGMRPGDPGWGEDQPDQYGELATEFSGLAVQGQIDTLPGRYHAFYQGLADAITSGSVVPVNPEDALSTIRLIEYALESHRKGCVIQVEE
ncbi:oxidoreductase domain protein [Paenibacillus algicola]|uniref:Oxidoreductase domain protein n=1 Tax=Paenibacillus algicola TaxID=2565926 RepID=A0A4P8XPA6_9BACL|nr:oxidoreductase [Paenibacillus algicola]QCT04686.1 oxidoreductase domain protein [Paenibacillus algicola]